MISMTNILLSSDISTSFSLSLGPRTKWLGEFGMVQKIERDTKGHWERMVRVWIGRDKSGLKSLEGIKRNK